MAIEPEWTDPDTLEKVATDYLTNAEWNAVLGMLDFLANPPQTAVRLTSSQSVADSTDHTITWHEAVWEAGAGEAMWDPVAPTKVIVLRDGPARVNIHTEYASDIPVDNQTITLEVNGAVRLGPIKGQQLSIETSMATNDQIEVIVRQSSGAAVNLNATRTRMTVVWSTMPLTGTT